MNPLPQFPVSWLYPHADNVFLYTPDQQFAAFEPVQTHDDNVFVYTPDQRFTAVEPESFVEKDVKGLHLPQQPYTPTKSVPATDQIYVSREVFEKYSLDAADRRNAEYIDERPAAKNPEDKAAPVVPKSTTFTEEPKKISFWSSRSEMGKYFNSKGGDQGKQIVQYFNCLNFVQCQNVVMTMWCVLGWAYWRVWII